MNNKWLALWLVLAILLFGFIITQTVHLRGLYSIITNEPNTWNIK